jgi:plasmid stabilization system protein ParE
MRVVYLRSTASDLKWLRLYYVKVFPDGHKNAIRQLKATEVLLSENPWIGRLYAGDEIRILNLPRTPFAFVYRVKQDRIEIIRVMDQRAHQQEP